MGRNRRVRPKRLAEKLLKIRLSLNLTMEQLIVRLDYSAVPLTSASITEYEKDKREPPLPILLRYARLSNVLLEALVDDELDLPEELPANRK